MFFKRFFLIACLAALCCVNSYAQSGEMNLPDRQAMTAMAEKDYSVYNEQKKELGKALFFLFSERYKESFPILQGLAQKDNPVASFYYAESLYNGWGVFPADRMKANDIFQQNINRIRGMMPKGDGLIPYTLYRAYQNGYGTPMDKQRAAKFLDIAIDKGYGLAIFDKAKEQEDNGHFQQALETYMLASRNGNPEANFRLGLIYETGENGVRQNYKEAFAYYSKAAEYGHIKAHANLGNLYYNGLGISQNSAEALRHFQAAAEKDNAAATNSLGVMYLKGEGGLPQNYNNAIRNFRKAAYFGDVNAYNNLGNMYFNGIGTKEDKAKAFDYYKKAAEQKNPEAMYKIAVMYEKGLGVREDKQKARKWYDALEDEGYDLNDF